MNKIRKFLTEHWKPKFICLAIAVLIWFGVRYGFVANENASADAYGEIILSTP